MVSSFFTTFFIKYFVLFLPRQLGMAKANEVAALPSSGLGEKKLLILMSILVVTFMVDSQIGYIADFIPERLVTDEGIALFICVAIIFAIGGILI
jgi:hypothetical protein